MTATLKWLCKTKHQRVSLPTDRRFTKNTLIIQIHWGIPVAAAGTPTMPVHHTTWDFQVCSHVSLMAGSTNKFKKLHKQLECVKKSWMISLHSSENLNLLTSNKSHFTSAASVIRQYLATNYIIKMQICWTRQKHRCGSKIEWQTNKLQKSVQKFLVHLQHTTNDRSTK